LRRAPPHFTRAAPQDRLTKERVATYNEAMRVCVEHRDELSSEFKASVEECYDKYGISHDRLFLE